MEPEWNESFAFESTEDEELLRINVIDADVITRDDLIGTVIIDLSSLINRENNQTIKGNFPIVDINLGIRGTLEVEIKLLNIVKDENLANNISSTLVQFFSTSNPPLNIVRQTYGFVEELVDFKRSDKDAENMIRI